MKTAKEPTKVKGVITKRIKQAGAELCQAQGKLILVWPLLDHCFLLLTRLKSKVLNLKGFLSSSLVEVSKSQKILGQKKFEGKKKIVAA